MKKIVIVEGMSCAHCKAAVEQAAKNVLGVTAAKVDLADKTLTVECGGEMTDEMLTDAIEEEGFFVGKISVG